LTVTLFTLLAASGIGSSVSSRWLKSRPFPGVAFSLVAVIGIGLVYTLFLSEWVHSLIGAPLPMRVGTSIALTAPIGLAMGMPMPIGISLLRKHSDSLVLWAWGINGFASVVAPVIAMLGAHLFGYRSVFGMGVVFYLFALLSLVQSRSRNLA
jgi:hypothetical protein